MPGSRHSLTWRTKYWLPIQLVASGLLNLQKRGACSFVHKDLYFTKINISHNCREKYLEICAIKLEIKSYKLITLNLQRTPTGDFNQSIKNVDGALKYPYKPKVEFLICGDINTGYLTER
jgi:hypothetical protein